MKRGRKDILNEARRLARNRICAAMREQGIKRAWVSRQEINSGINQLIELDPKILWWAKRNLNARMEGKR